MRTLLISIAIAALLCACSKPPQPIVESIKPAQQTLEAAKGLEQTLQKDLENREKKSAQE